MNNDFIALAKKRTSCRKYLDKEVSDSLINNCLEAARWAPSACNKQPWRFVIVKNKKIRTDICENGLLPGIPMPWLKTAPVIIALCADVSVFTHKIAPWISGVQYHLIDLGIAGEHLVLAAEEQGLATCWIGWFNKKQIRKILSIPKNIEVASLISLGFPAETPAPQSRLHIDDISFTDSWIS